MGGIHKGKGSSNELASWILGYFTNSFDDPVTFMNLHNLLNLVDDLYLPDFVL